MAYGQAPVQPLPVVNATLGPTYATQVNAAIAELRAIVGAKVTPAGIDINGDLSFRSGASYYAATNLSRAGLHTNTSALDAATYPGALYAGPAGELYYNDSAGNQVALTLNGSVTGAAGNIDGTGYGATGVSITWDAANALYSFFSGSGTYADGKFDDVLLYDGAAYFVRHTAQAMAADYTVTWPAAVPATSNSVVAVSTAGTLTFSATPTLTSVTTTGAGVIGSTLSAAGLITATSGVTAGANTHVTVSGTGRHKHGSMQIVIPAAAWRTSDSDDSFETDATDLISTITGSGVKLVAPLMLPVGTRITAVNFRGRHGGATTNRTYSVCYSETGGGTRVVLGSNTNLSQNAYTSVNVSGLTETTVNSRQYWLEFLGVVLSGDGMNQALVTYDFP